MVQPFYRLAMFLYKSACIHKIPLTVNRQVEADLQKLHPDDRKEQLLTEYYVDKLAKSLMIFTAGIFIGVVMGIRAAGESLLSDNGGIVRGAYMEGAREVQIETSVDGIMHSFEMELTPMLLSEEELAEWRGQFQSELPGVILGGNTSLQEVSEDLNLQESYEGYPFIVSWESDCVDALRSDGTVGDVEKAREVMLKAVVSYEGIEWEEVLCVTVIPEILSEEELVHRELERLLLVSEEESRSSEEWLLPTEWKQQELVWTQKKEHVGLFLGLGDVTVAILVFFLADKDLHEEVEMRKQRMKKGYPDVIHKLVLYLGAGMTIRGSFQKIGEESEKVKDTAKGKKLGENPIYEEILHTCRELKAGVSEGAAYEHFGKRTGLQEYIRLSALLSQNLKKGNSALLQRLREEAQKATMERIQYGKRLGEEAVTKLLLPMVMMLLVVMLMIMIPAFSSVGM